MAYPAPNAVAGNSAAHAPARTNCALIELIAAPRRVEVRCGRASARPGLGSGVELADGLGEALVDVGHAVAQQHRLAHPLAGLEPRFERLRRHLLAARGDQQFLEAVGDEEIALLVEPPDVAGVEPAVAQRKARRFLAAEVALHDAGSAGEDLPLVADLHLDAGNRRAPPAGLSPARRLEAGHRRGSGGWPSAFSMTRA